MNYSAETNRFSVPAYFVADFLSPSMKCSYCGEKPKLENVLGGPNKVVAVVCNCRTHCLFVVLPD